MERSMPARLYKPTKTAMQSGRAKTHEWIVEFESTERKKQDPLMGWAGSRDTQTQVFLKFPTQDAAIAYCKGNGIEFAIVPSQETTLKLKAYADNFRYDRAR
jgi:hypothetical protein